MKVRTFLAALTLAALTVAATPAAAQQPSPWAAGVELGIAGPGVTVAHHLADRLDVRASYAGIAANLAEDDTIELSGVDYDADVEFAAGGIYLDYYLGDTQLRLTGGIAYVHDTVDLVAKLRPGASYPIGDGTYTAEEIGALTGRSAIASPGAYLGVGWGNPFGGSSRWGFRADIGLIYREEAEVSLQAANPGADPSLDVDVAREAERLADDFGRFRPVLSVGVSYRF